MCAQSLQHSGVPQECALVARDRHLLRRWRGHWLWWRRRRLTLLRRRQWFRRRRRRHELSAEWLQIPRRRCSVLGSTLVRKRNLPDVQHQHLVLRGPVINLGLGLSGIRRQQELELVPRALVRRGAHAEVAEQPSGARGRAFAAFAFEAREHAEYPAARDLNPVIPQGQTHEEVLTNWDVWIHLPLSRGCSRRRRRPLKSRGRGRGRFRTLELRCSGRLRDKPWGLLFNKSPRLQ
mmetsp:Transcript_55732/g.155329  ORF Transcript_55732/g.155329 Transcript_55732/m.155329 type:complete len:235 (+) Transcript_55732:330-1034(+)